MQEQGKVISKEDNKAYVQIDIGKACHECKLCDRGTPIILVADNSLGADVGETVKLETAMISKVKGIIFYLTLPPLALVSGIIGGDLIATHFKFDRANEIIGLISGLFLFALSLLFAWWLDKKNKTLSSKIVEIY
ncbi:MAG: SoxR reducing system RseC family protein [bacterium]